MPNIDTGLFINTSVATDRTTAPMARRALMALFGQRGDATTQPGRINGSGVTGSGALALKSSSTSALSYVISAGYAIVIRTAAPTLGGYVVGTLTDTTVTLAAANASNPRIDAIYICQPDPEAGDTGHARIDVVTGTPAASPAAPADSTLPQGSLRLFNITVPAAATAASATTVTTIGAFEAAANNALPIFANTAALPATAPFQARALVQTFTTDIGVVMPNVVMRWNGSAWRPYDSDWVQYTPQVQGLLGNPGVDPGYVAQTRFRYVEGQIEAYFALQLINGGSNGNVRFILPAYGDNATTGLNRNIYFQTLPTMAAFVYRKLNGAEYQMDLSMVNNNFMRLIGYNGVNGQRVEAGNGQPVAWGDGDIVSGQFKYAPVS